MNMFEEKLLKQYGRESYEKIRNIRIGIAGAGGLGSNCAFNLVRAGFRKLVIADFDVVSPSNLNRQFFFLDQVGMAKVEALEVNLKRINPDIEVKTYNGKVTCSNATEIFSSCEIVAEAFDRVDQKTMLVGSILKTGKFVVAGSGLGGYGESDQIKTFKIGRNLVVVGDLNSDVISNPPVSPRVNVAAAKQADVILERVLCE
ncbi:MAG: sulfur carrier protein ThiS adenylyltransferase ThiF [Candidatus Sabulitectum sp.]|nr:sulfur carrier protein ThiS adenylyltransferase ThiF [Candidatus Sabulitectum sp.]